MSLRENLQEIFALNTPPTLEEITKAQEKERAATVEYLEGRMTLDDYKQLLESTFPVTKLDLRKLASELNFKG